MEFLKKLFLPITLPLKFIQDHFKAMLFLLLVAVLFAPIGNQELTPHNLEKISITGPIFDATEIIEKIQKAQKNDSIRGVLILVNSPGGAVAPSVEIAHAIKRLKTYKPVVVYSQGAMTSGSYYASIWADKIVANPGSIIGSIGVIMQGADLSELMSTLGIKSQSIQAGKYKKVGTPDREWNELEKQELDKVIQGTYEMFTQDVANARKLDINKTNEFADAHIFTAKQAKKVGLVDQVGVIFEAEELLYELSGVSDPVWNQQDKFEQIMKKLSASSSVILYTYFPTLTLK